MFRRSPLPLLLLVLSATFTPACDWWDDITDLDDGEVSLRAENRSDTRLLMGEFSFEEVEPGESRRVLRFDERLETREFSVKSPSGVLLLEIEAEVRHLPSNGTCTSTIEIIKRPGERFYTTDHDDRCTVEIVSVRQF